MLVYNVLIIQIIVSIPQAGIILTAQNDANMNSNPLRFLLYSLFLILECESLQFIVFVLPHKEQLS